MPIAYADDTIQAFEAAAQLRYDEADQLLRGGFHAGAVYLDGYVVELVLKAAVFRALGYGPAVPIPTTVRAAIEANMRMDSLRPEGQHDILRWAQWLVGYAKLTFTGAAYDPAYGDRIVGEATVVDSLWHPNMRYRAATVARADADRIHQAAFWLLSERPNL